MLRRIWRWLASLFVGGKKSSPGKPLGDLATTEEPNLSDTDYEFLFNQLLEGVTNGWPQGRIVKFFEQLGSRGKAVAWLDWLQVFGAKVLAAESPNEELARRMLELGQRTYSDRTIGEIGRLSYAIGEQLLSRRPTASQIWDYSGADLVDNSSNDVSFPLSSTPEDPNTSAQPISIEQLYEALVRDPNLAAEIAQQMSISSTDPHLIVNELMHKLNTLQPLSENQNTANHERDLFNVGLQQANSGDLVSAIASWEALLSLNPRIAQAWHNRGTALGSLGKWEEALDSFDHALQLQPQDYQSWNDRGNTLYNLQRWQEALESWEKVLEISPDYYQAWYNRGCALENLGLFSESITSYQRALLIKPDFYLAESRLRNLSQNL